MPSLINQSSDLFSLFERLDNGERIVLPNPLVNPEVAAADRPAFEGPVLGVWSSGSTGRPKLVWIEWHKVKADARTNSRFTGWRWGTPFPFWTFAGAQVAVQAWINSGAVLSLSRQWDEAWAQLIKWKPEAISATPTYLDLLIQNEPPTAADWAPRQVTLGGEVVGAATGERVRQRVPNGNITCIYASAELGVIAKTHRTDGWYETADLSRRWEGWRVSGGVFELRREGGDVWIMGKDHVEVRDDLFRVLGRADAVANVAGTKVNLDEVAARAEEIKGVLRAVAYGQPNRVTGQVVGLRIEPAPGSIEGDLRERVQEGLRRVLPKEAWPREFEVGPVTVGASGKRERAGREE